MKILKKIWGTKMAKIETKQGNVTLPSYMWNELGEKYKELRLNTRSDLIYKYCKEGLASEDIIPLHLKVANAKDAISVKLDSLLNTQNCAVYGSLTQKLDTGIALNSRFGSSKYVLHTKYSYNVALFEIIEDIKQIDLDEYGLINIILKKYPTFKRKYGKYVKILNGQTTL